MLSASLNKTFLSLCYVPYHTVFDTQVAEREITPLWLQERDQSDDTWLSERTPPLVTVINVFTGNHLVTCVYNKMFMYIFL